MVDPPNICSPLAELYAWRDRLRSKEFPQDDSDVQRWLADVEDSIAWREQQVAEAQKAA
jgi:hypothetical protein